MEKIPTSFIKTLFFFISGYRRHVFILIVLSIITGAISSIDSFFLKKIIDIVSEVGDDQAPNIFKVLLPWIIGCSLWWEVCNWIWRYYDYIYLKSMPYMKGRVIDEIYNYIQYHSHKFFQDNFTGSISHRITDAARSFEMVFSIANEKILKKLVTIVIVLSTMAIINPIFSLIFAIWLVIFFSLSVVFSRYILNFSKTFTEYKATTVGKLVDVITNVYSVRMFSAHNFERKYLNSYIDSISDSERKMQWFMFKLRYILGSSCSILIFCIIYALAVLRSNLSVTIGDFVMILSLCVTTIEDIWDLMQEFGDLYEEIGIFNQCMSLIQPYLIEDIEDARQLKVIEGNIEFIKVDFNYPNKNKIFDQQSVYIPGKQIIGLVGFSGSGKSTFISLISRLYDVSSGKILIDGQDIKEVTQPSLRDSITIIPQEPILFHRTIKENIQYGNLECSDKQIIDAAKKANLHNFVMSLPDGYNTLCGEQGGNLSGGQRQMVIIARAILKNSPILILDEATAALDSLTEALIQQSLNYLMQDKTVLIIAHRLSTILHTDRILVFENGKIVEDGKHDKLLENGKLYKKLWSSQVQGFIPESPSI